MGASWFSRGGAGACPPSDRLCDVAALAFALWTICCHAVVAGGGSLRQLLAVYASASAAAIGGWFVSGRRRNRVERGSPTPNVPADSFDRWRIAARISACGVGLIAVLALDPEANPAAVWWITVGLLGAAAVPFLLAEPVFGEEPRQRRWLELTLWGVGAACLCAALVIQRPDIDDSFYINVAVAAADSPGSALLGGDTLLGVAGLPLHMPAHRMHTYELWNAAIAFVTGIPAIYCFHFVSAGLVALLVPLAHARLFRVLTPHHWIWAVSAVVVVLLASGETHRSFGNFSFARIWQGKGVFLFFFMPLVYAHGIRFALRPTPMRWLLLAAAQIGAVGCSSTAVWAAPTGAMMALCCALRPTRRNLGVFALGALASAYVLFAGWILKGELEPMLASEIRRFEFGAQLDSALSHVFGKSHLLESALAASLLSWACWGRGLARRFAIVFPLAVWAILLNPYWDGWISGNLTGPSYWRVVWSLPTPILTALILTAPLQLQGARSRAIGRMACCTAIVAFAIWIPDFSTLSERNGGAADMGIRVGMPDLKVPPGPYRWAKRLSESVPPGSVVVAPPRVSYWIPTFHDRAYPLQARRLYLERQGGTLGTENADARTLMTLYVSGATEWRNPHEMFRLGLEQFAVTGVCLRNSSYIEASRTVLRGAGFEKKRGGNYEIWVKTEPAADLP